MAAAAGDEIRGIERYEVDALQLEPRTLHTGRAREPSRADVVRSSRNPTSVCARSSPWRRDKVRRDRISLGSGLPSADACEELGEPLEVVDEQPPLGHLIVSDVPDLDLARCQ